MNIRLVEVKSATITRKGQIAIPKDIRELEGFREGSKIAILAYEDRVELVPIEKAREKIMKAGKSRIEYSF
jgi:AbrB family looped-hinge helix DNA binding protein